MRPELQAFAATSRPIGHLACTRSTGGEGDRAVRRLPPWPLSQAFLLAPLLAFLLGTASCTSTRGPAPEPARDLSPLVQAAPSAPTTATAPPAPPAPPPPVAPRYGEVLGRNEQLLVYVPLLGDSLQSIAARFLGSADEAWQLVQANPGVLAPTPGQPLVVPLAPRFTLGVTPEGVQAVPILCYHRIANGPSKMAVTPANFEAQLQWLADNGWRVVRLSDYAAFMAGRKALPPRAVVITFDDGYASVHRHAFATLKKHGAPATLFLYTDFLGASDALNWAQLEEMWHSGLIDIQAHSKAHRRLTERAEGQSEAAYRQQLDLELKHPRAVLERRLAAAGLKVRYFAYPYGDANETVLEATRRAGYELGLTVVPGANPFYASPLLLRRVMIYGDHTLEDFKARLTIQHEVR